MIWQEAKSNQRDDDKDNSDKSVLALQQEYDAATGAIDEEQEQPQEKPASRPATKNKAKGKGKGKAYRQYQQAKSKKENFGKRKTSKSKPR